MAPSKYVILWKEKDTQFVCTTTRNVHIDVTTSLTTTAEAAKSQEVREFLTEHKIVVERRILRETRRSSQASLIVSLRRKSLNDEQFRTCVAECQAVVNNRPLTY